MRDLKRGDRRRQNDPTRARTAKAAKREAARCKWSRACRTEQIPGSPFCFLHSKAVVGEARASTTPDDAGAALLYPSGRLMGTDPELVALVREALDAIEDEEAGDDEA